MPLRILILVLLALTAVSGCGRRGPLEAPGAEPAAATDAAPVGYGISPLDPGAPAVAPPPQQQLEPAPRRRFLLDFLL